MNPKCPWCGESMSLFTLRDKRWFFSCTNKKCLSKKTFTTKEKALASASKRFMPKRSVEEIENFVRNENDRRIEYIKQASEAGEINEVINSIANLGHATMATRIADYMTGVTE